MPRLRLAIPDRFALAIPDRFPFAIPDRLPRLMRWTTVSLAVALAGCSPAKSVPKAAPPRAEFLLSSPDSTFWIATAAAGGQTRVRGAPLVLANYDGRFYEIYDADDDFSYADATLLGDRVYRRDIITGDSALVFVDTAVRRYAQAYAKAHPDERPLSPDEEGEANPSTQVTVEVDVLGINGPHLSYEYHLDIALPGRRPRHSTRRGVLDLRSGKLETVADLFGTAPGNRIVAEGRRTYAAIRDSVLRTRAQLSVDEQRAAAALSRLQFDDRSFTISSAGRRPEVTFAVPASGEGPAANVLELDPLPVDSVAWWGPIVSGLPSTDDTGEDRWTGKGYRVLARYDTTGETAHLFIADSTNRQWPMVTVLGPLRRIDWLDQPPIGATQRQALTRAFNQAAAYDHDVQVASAATRAILNPARSHALRPVSLAGPLPALQERSRKPARDVRAHDAGACQQPRPCVRRRHPVDDGQVRGDRGVPARPGERGHGVDRSRRLSRADSPRRSRGHAVERELGGADVDGGGCAGGGRGSDDRPAAAHQLVLSDLRCR